MGIIFLGHVGQTYESKYNIDITRNQEQELLSGEISPMYSFRDGNVDNTAALNKTVAMPAIDLAVYENARSCFDTPGVVNKQQVNG